MCCSCGFDLVVMEDDLVKQLALNLPQPLSESESDSVLSTLSSASLASNDSSGGSSNSRSSTSVSLASNDSSGGSSSSKNSNILVTTQQSRPKNQVDTSPAALLLQSKELYEARQAEPVEQHRKLLSSFVGNDTSLISTPLPAASSVAEQKQRDNIEEKQQQLLVMLGKIAQHEQHANSVVLPISPRGINKAYSELLTRTKNKLINQCVKEGQLHREEGRNLHALSSFRRAIMFKEQPIPKLEPTPPNQSQTRSNSHKSSPRTRRQHAVVYETPPPSTAASIGQRLSPWTPNNPAWASSMPLEWNIIEENAQILSVSNFFSTSDQHHHVPQDLKGSPPLARRKIKKRKKVKHSSTPPSYILNFGRLPAVTNYRKPLKSQRRFPVVQRRARFEEEESIVRKQLRAQNESVMEWE